MKSLWSFVVGLLILKSIDAYCTIFSSETWEPSGEEYFGDCVTPRRERGQCIPLHSCRPVLDLLAKTPQTYSDRKFLRRIRCGYACDEVLVCCSSRDGSRAGLVDGASLLPAPGQCGIGNFDKRIEGKQTKIDEFPWMALLIYADLAGTEVPNCAGSLINNRYVLTAAHCVNGQQIPRDWRLTSVRLGEWDTDTEIDCDDGDCNQPPVYIPIEELITHEDHRPRTVNSLHDIALLRLSRPVTYTEFIMPICLPSTQHLRDATFEGVSLEVAAWGMTKNAIRSNVILKSAVKGFNFDACKWKYRQKSKILQHTQLCAGGEKGVDSCAGDSGGPLMQQDFIGSTGPFVFLAGIVSFGPHPCGREGWPAVYTRVGSYIDWIQRKIRP